jgi:hypothetical protein
MAQYDYERDEKFGFYLVDKGNSQEKLARVKTLEFAEKIIGALNSDASDCKMCQSD